MRLQEFIELVRDENYLQALNYAENQLAPWGDLEEVKQATATLDFTKDTLIPTYKVSLTVVVSNQILHRSY